EEKKKGRRKEKEKRRGREDPGGRRKAARGGEGAGWPRAAPRRPYKAPRGGGARQRRRGRERGRSRRGSRSSPRDPRRLPAGELIPSEATLTWQGSRRVAHLTAASPDGC
ncbi:hypothetical protein DV515_00011177, partial [Chloebia gouldiae]